MARHLSPPPVIGGYSYVRPLGTGGFADVFLYEQDMPRRVAAVKVLLADAVNPDVRRTFNAEADILAKLSAHPAIVTIYQASISADGRPYFAMEYCPETMSARYKKGRLAVAEVLDIGVRIAGALETVHRAGLLHRDIKPSNILVNALGSPVLADFGIAAAASADDDSPEMFAMSIPWSSPEVLQERVTGSVASEIWSLGATLYTLLAGRSPFEVTTRDQNTREQLTRRIVRAKYTAVPIQRLPLRIDEILSKAMDRDPSKRFASMAEFAEQLRWTQYDLGIPSTSFETASTEWAAASPVRFTDARQRGPVITTVDRNSRRAARAARESKGVVVDRDGVTVAGSSRSSLRAGILGAGIAAAVCVAVGVVVLFTTGVF